jgi:hypothetical protein
MIEFAPNPSGPAHLGTLRTYAVAYLEARRTNQPLFLRFDAWDRWEWLSPRWADAFLQELAALELMPDHWQYYTDAPLLACAPTWAICFPLPIGADADPGSSASTKMYFPETINAVIPDRRPSMWRSGNEKMPTMRIRTDPAINAPDPYTSFGVWDAKAAKFRVWGCMASLIYMSLRGTTAVVRSHPLFYVRLFQETFAAKWFGFRLPEVIYAGMVADEKGGLKKSELKPEQPGTVGHAIATFGKEHVRKAVLRSAREDQRAIIPMRDILC